MEDTDDVCEVCGTYGRHKECDEKARRWEEEERARLMQFALNGKFGPQSSDPALSLKEASQLLAADLGQRHDFDTDGVIENEGWWFIPHGGVGMIGFVVDKQTGAVTDLGSGSGPLSRALEQYESGRMDPSPGPAKE